MKALWNDQVIAEASNEDLIYIEGNWYFPPSSVREEYFQTSPTPYVCPWKGVCQYYTIGHNSRYSQDAAWTYPSPKPSALAAVKKDFSNYFAFSRDIRVEP